MGPKSKVFGLEVPSEELIWQDPVPSGSTSYDVKLAKTKIAESDLTIQEMIETAWASASTFRGSDLRGGANGARIRLAPQKGWEVNKPEQLSRVLGVLEKIALETGASVVDIIVLAGNGELKKPQALMYHSCSDRDATQETTDEHSFKVLELIPMVLEIFIKDFEIGAEHMLLDKVLNYLD